MLDISGYNIKEQLYQGKRFTIYRGIQHTNQRKVILKVCRFEQPSLQELATLKHEYQLLKQLNLPQVINVYDLIKHQNQLVLVLEDIEGCSLKQYLDGQPLSLNSFFTIAIQLTDALHALHLQHIIHKDINPNNIAIEPNTLTAKLIDFSASSQLNQETQAVMPENLEGTLNYIAPEQTGRMNCLVDYRADFYSLGVTFYEMLTGCVPFNADDPLELIYSHLAKTPAAVNEINPEVPQVIAAIVAKLMAKLPEERYASAAGLRVDLLESLQQWQALQHIEPFPLGQQDFSTQLTISQKLYGRESQIEQLLTAYERTSDGACEWILIAGYSGIGKTSLVKELYKPITRQRGYFISGKYDQLQRTTPYSAIIEAFQDLVRRLLAEPPERLSQLKDELLAALGSNAQVIIDVIPTIALIIGSQPSVIDLPPEQTQHRFCLSFQSFVRAIAKPEHPLTLFLDDLQWIDSASLQLLQQLATDPKLQYFLFLGAYRDNEVSIEHPLMLTVDLLKKSNVALNTLTLMPLEQSAVLTMLADSFNCLLKKLEPLAILLLSKTQGNPFFINEFLKTLYQKQLLYFAHHTQEWQWDIAAIEEQDITDNVVELLLGRMRELPESTQKALSLAACVGHTFDLSTLTLINECPLADTAHSLWEAVQAYFIKPLGDSYKFTQALEEDRTIDNDLIIAARAEEIRYRFIHDRIQQAAYLLIPAAVKQETHLQIGRLLLKGTVLHEHDEKLFEVLNHINNSLNLITDAAERLQLAQYNLWAGCKAKKSNAYQAAISYLTAGIALLPADPWQTTYQLTFDLYKALAESCYLVADYTAAEQHIQLLLTHARDLLEKVDVYVIKILMLGTLNQLEAGIKLGVKTLRMLGLSLPEKTQTYHIVLGIIAARWSLGLRKLTTLELQPSTDPKRIKIDNIAVHLANVTYMLDQNLLALIVYRIVALTFKDGYTPDTPFALLGAAMVELHNLHHYEDGFAFAALGEAVGNKLGHSAVITRLKYSLGSYILHYKYPAEKSLEYLTSGYQVGLETGDILYASYNLGQLPIIKFAIGKPLTDVHYGLHATWLFKIKNKLPEFDILWKIFRNIVESLQGSAPKFITSFADVQQALAAVHNYSEMGYANCFFASYCYLLEDFELTLNICESNEAYEKYLLGAINYPQQQFFYALAIIACYPAATQKAQKRYRRKLAALRKRLKRWATWCPINFEQYHLLIAAEVAKLQQQTLLAIDLYDKAINAAYKSDTTHIVGIANECAARFYLRLQKPHLAKSYLQAAHYAFSQWGAIAKCQAMEQTYSEWLQHALHPMSPSSAALMKYTSNDTPLAAIDVLSILKSAQAISREIQLDRLLKKLLYILLENAGAQRGMLLMRDHHHWFVKAEGTIAAQEVTLSQTKRIDSRHDIPLSLIQYAQRSCEPILLQNPQDFERYYADDTYLEQIKPRSVLILPVLYQSELASLFFFENREISCAFTPESIQTLQLLASQAAISLENAQLYYQATHDTLTGLANRNLLYHLFERATVKAKREKTLIAILFLDLDGFKTINDTLGHEAGDKLLLHFTKELKANLRESDLAARLGGDEFIVMMEDLSDNMQAANFAKRLLQKLAPPVNIAGHAISISSSIGISLYPQDGVDIQTLLKQADTALYHVKESGKNHYQFFSNSR